MQTVEQIATNIVGREGGYVNDPNDPGGATKYGVTIHTMRRLGLDLDNDGDVDKFDVRKLTKEHAVKIFVQHYFYKPKIDRLPKGIQASVFDMYVNSGSNAVKILQNLLQEFGEDIVVDGILGVITLRISHKTWGMAPRHFCDAYGIARRNYYYSLADRRVKSRKYVVTKAGKKGGWIRRAEEFISAQYHFSSQQHADRIQRWV